MKTSNKILLIALISLFVVVLLGILAVRMQAREAGYRMFFSPPKVVGFEQKIFGNGKIATQNYPLPNTKFNAIDLTLASHVDVKIADKPQGRGVAISTDSNSLPYLSVEVQNGTLYIFDKRGVSLLPSTPIKITINAVMADGLRSIISRGASDVMVENLASDNFYLEINGSGDNVLKGKAKNFSVNINGSGSVDAKNLEAHHTKVTINGSGNAVVVAKKSISVTINGSGDVKYYGNPARISHSIRGSGAIREVER